MICFGNAINKKLILDTCRLRFVGILQYTPLSFYIRQPYAKKLAKHFY